MDAQVLEGELQAKLEILNGYYYLADVGYPLLNENFLLLTMMSGIILWSGAGLIKSKKFYLISNPH